VGRAGITVASSYPAGVPNPNPATRYHLAHLGFNQLYGVNGAGTPGATCGHLDEPMTIYITRASWLDPAGTEHFWTGQAECVAINDPNHQTGCAAATAARPVTWGAIRAQYR
jgi:hypothetical protein